MKILETERIAFANGKRIDVAIQETGAGFHAALSGHRERGL